MDVKQSVRWGRPLEEVPTLLLNKVTAVDCRVNVNEAPVMSPHALKPQVWYFDHCHLVFTLILLILICWIWGSVETETYLSQQ